MSNFLAKRSSCVFVSLNGGQRLTESGRNPEREGSSEEAKTAFARAYAGELTQPELEGLLAFYRTPAGRSLVRVQPRLTALGAQIGAELAEKRQGELESMVQARAEELESLPVTPGVD